MSAAAATTCRTTGRPVPPVPGPDRHADARPGCGPVAAHVGGRCGWAAAPTEADRRPGARSVGGQLELERGGGSAAERWLHRRGATEPAPWARRRCGLPGGVPADDRRADRPGRALVRGRGHHQRRQRERERQGARLHQRLHPRSGRDSRPARVRAAGLGPRRRRSDHRVQTGSLPRQHTRRLRRLHRPRRVRGRLRQRPTAAHRRGVGRHAASGHPRAPWRPHPGRPPGGRSPPGRWSEPATGCCRPRSRPRWPNVPARTRSG